jgi:hypothetical protein
MRADEPRAEGGLTILDQQPGEGGEPTWTLGDAPPGGAGAAASGESELLRAERMLVGSGKEENYYGFYGLHNFQAISEAELRAVTERKDRMVDLAEREWGGNERTEARFNELNKALNRAFTRLTQQKTAFDKELRKALLDKLGTIVDQYLKTNQIGSASIEIDEYRAIMEEYEGNRVLSADRQDELRAFHEDFARLVAERDGEIIDLDTEFAESIKGLLRRDFIDIPEKRTSIAGIYGELKEADHYIRTLVKKSFTERELMPEIEASLARVGLAFRRKEEVFETEVFKPFAERLGVAGGGQIDSFNFGQLMVKARDEYFFSEDEVRSFCDAHGVKVKEEVELKFNFGFTADRSRKLEAKSYEEIVALFEEFPEKAKMKLYDGDLEVYLDNLGNLELLEKVRGICAEYAPEGEHEAGLRKTIYTLLPARPYRTPGGTECAGIEELGDAIEREFGTFRKPLLNERNHEALLFLEARNAREVAHEVRVWASSGKSEAKRLNGIVWVLQGKILKREDARFTSVDQIVRLEDGPFKARLATELAEEDSKFSVWIEENHSGLAKNVERWRKLKRYNAVTLTYALESKSPFHYGHERAYDPTDMAKDILKRHAQEKEFLAALLSKDSPLRTEADFWLKEYHSTEASAVLRTYLGLVAGDISFRKANDKVLAELADAYSRRGVRECWEELMPIAEELKEKDSISLEAYSGYRKMVVKLVNGSAGVETDRFIQQYLKKRIDEPNADKELILEFFRYFQRPSMGRELYIRKIQPLLEEAVRKGVVEEQVLEWQRNYFIEKYEQEIPKASFDDKLATLDAIKALDSEHPLVALYQRSANSMKEAVKRKNVIDRTKNALRRDFIAALSLLLTLGISFIPFLHRSLSWSPVHVNTTIAGTLLFWILVVGLLVTIVALKKRRR